MIVMYFVWLILKRRPLLKTHAIALPIEDEPTGHASANIPRKTLWLDLVDTAEVDLFRDEYQDDAEDIKDDQERERRLRGRGGWLWSVYYLAA